MAKEPCSDCGKLFLPKTLENNGGKCGRCAKKTTPDSSTVECDDFIVMTNFEIPPTIEEEEPLDDQEIKAPSPTPVVEPMPSPAAKLTPIADLTPGEILDRLFPDRTDSVYWCLDARFYERHTYGTGRFDPAKHTNIKSFLHPDFGTIGDVCNSSRQEHDGCIYYEFIGDYVKSNGLCCGSFSVFLRLSADDDKKVDFSDWL